MSGSITIAGTRPLPSTRKEPEYYVLCTTYSGFSLTRRTAVEFSSESEDFFNPNERFWCEPPYFQLARKGCFTTYLKAIDGLLKY